ncbi:MAG: PhoH family protein [Proteobacteria bacterium]|nr:PhoH family protein [Pseudomonadota bacterium]
MAISESTRHITLTPADNKRLAILCGELGENLRIIERHLGVEINNRGNEFLIIGIPMSVEKACEILQKLFAETASGKELTDQQIQLLMKSLDMKYEFNSSDYEKKLVETTLKLELSSIKPRTANQIHYIRSIQKYDINFGVGPSGTGKTYLAVACALNALQNDMVKRIILVRPAVEAGESLGFLPGDLAQKIDPYLRPLYDALYEMSGTTAISKLIEKGTIEIAPLAYMRGRTLNDAFIILDEGQNTSKEQMKMFLTRIGFGSKAVITGDITQIDLPPKMESGLRHAISLLRNIPAIRFSFFQSADVVRHPLVQQIIEAYEQEKH